MNKYCANTIGKKPTYRVYDILTNKYSVGWILLYCGKNPYKWIPIWED
jgi:hypothetical protein